MSCSFLMQHAWNPRDVATDPVNVLLFDTHDGASEAEELAGKTVGGPIYFGKGQDFGYGYGYGLVHG